jgi:hypothetical protein
MQLLNTLAEMASASGSVDKGDFVGTPCDGQRELVQGNGYNVPCWPG